MRMLCCRCFAPRYSVILSSFFFFFNDPATTEIYTLSYTTLFRSPQGPAHPDPRRGDVRPGRRERVPGRTSPDRKSTRLNSSHTVISYAVFCLKKKKKNIEKPENKRSRAVQLNPNVSIHKSNRQTR